MQKQILRPEQPGTAVREWIGTDRISTIGVTSEDPAAPIENVFEPGENAGWRAAGPGPQEIRITLIEPMALSRIELEFQEPTRERTQEFVIRWAKSAGGPTQELVRQRWNFSPNGSTREHEQYTVNLDGVLILELRIDPDISRSDAIASLTHLNIAAQT